MDELDIVTIKKRTIHGVFSLISRNFVLYLISTAASLLIFTILSQRDIGIYTAVIAVQRVISFFTDFGLGAALVQKKNELTEDDLKTSFTIQFLATLLIFLIIFFLRGAISTFFKLDVEGENLLLALVFCVFLSSFKTIPSILMERKIEFNKLVIPQITESLIFNILLILFVLKGFGINSFTVSFLASSIVGIPVYYIISRWKPKIGITRESLRHLRFGINFQLKNIIATLKDDLLTVFLTKLLSFTEIGYIGFAQRLSFLFYRYVVDSVTKVTFSTYSRIQEDKALLKKAIEKSLFFVASAMFPVLFGLIIVIPYIINYFPRWHNKWEPAMISVAFFSLNALISSFSGIFVNFLDATGKVKQTLKLMVLWTTLTWIFTPLLIKFLGFNGVSIASFMVTLTIGVTFYLVKKIVEFDFWKMVHKPLISSIIMMGAVFIIENMFVKNLLSLILTIMVGGAIYISIFYLIAKEEIKRDLAEILAKK